MTRKINVLHIIAGLPLGGAENILYTLSKNIDKKKYNFIFCCLDEEGIIADSIRKDGFEVICLKEPRFRYIWRQMYNLYRLIKDNNIDIVHTHLYKADFWGRLAAFIARVPVICKSEHTVQHPMAFGVWSKISLPLYNITRLLGVHMFLDKITDAIIYNTEYARDSFIGRKFDQKKHYVVSGGFTVNRLGVSADRNSLRKKLGFSPDDIIIIIVARLTERKGHKYLFEAVAKLSSRYPNMKLLVAGEGHLKDTLHKLAVDLGVENRSIFTGKVENVQEYIKLSDMLVLPSWREALGIVLLEAMYLEVPVIGADEAGIPEMIEDGISGCLVKTRDSESIEKAVLKIINEPNRLKKIIENAKLKVTNEFSEEIFTNKYEDIYKSLLEKKDHLLSKKPAGYHKINESLRVMFFGDMAFNFNPDRAADLNGNNDNIFNDTVRLFKQADLIIGNLESPLPGDGRENILKKPRAIADPDAFGNILKLKPDILCLANNHIADALENGYKQTTDYLKKNSILYLGAGYSDEEAARPLIFEKNNCKIGLLNYIDEDTNPCLPDDCKLKLNFFNLDRALKELNDLKDRIDIRVVVLHWGKEYCHYPTPRQQKIAKLLSKNGADIIVGHHAHTIQPVQRYKKTVIAYGLGNFYFPNIWFENRLYRKWTSRNRESIILDVKISQKGMDGFSFHRTLQEGTYVHLSYGNIYLRMKMMQFVRALLRWNIFWETFSYLRKVISIFKLTEIDTNNKKIAYIVGRFPGVQPFIINEIKEIRSLGFDITLFSTNNPKGNIVKGEWADSTVYVRNYLAPRVIFSQFYYFFRRPTVYIQLLLKSRKFGGWPILWKSVYFAYIVARKNIRHVHAHFAWDEADAALIISKLSGVPYSVTAHQSDIHRTPIRLYQKLARAKFILTCTKGNEQYLGEKFGLEVKNKTHTVYHGIDVDRFYPSVSFPEKDIDVLGVGNLIGYKGFNYLIDACRILVSKGFALKCVILGEGDLRNHLEKEIRNLGLEKYIQLMDYVPYEKIREYYLRAKVFSLPVTILDGAPHGIPNVVAEAMAMGLPVVVTNVPHISELVVNNETGFLVPDKDPISLADSIAKLLIDDVLRKTIGEKARERILADFNLKKHTKRIAEFIYPGT